MKDGWSTLRDKQPAAPTAAPKKTLNDLFKKPTERNTRSGKGLKVVLYGPPKVGKTYVCLDFPPPVFVLNSEPTGVIRLLHFFPDKDIREFPMYEKWVDAGITDDTQIALMSIAALDEAIAALTTINEGTIVLDSATHVWQWIQRWLPYKVGTLGRKSGQEVYGFDWNLAFEEYRTRFLKLLVRPCNFVCTAQTKEVYVADKPTGKWAGRWMSETPHMCDVVFRMEKKEVPQNTADLKSVDFVTKYIATFEDSRFARPLVKQKQMEIEDLTYQKLLDAVLKTTGCTKEVLGIG
jgi:hypothetical protein